MKTPSYIRALSSLAILAATLITQAHAILDTNANALSDLWEKQYNNGNLFASSILAANDEDFDSWTNAQEAAAGTDPFDPNPPDGIVTVTLTPSLIEGAFTLTWPTLIGKSYQLKVSTDLVTWSNLGEPVTTYQNTHSIGINTIQPDDTIPPKVFWQVVVCDIDYDNDGLTNSEEHALGSNDWSIDSDYDTLPDHWEGINNFDPSNFYESDADADPDNDGIANRYEYLLGHNPHQFTPDATTLDRDQDGMPDLYEVQTARYVWVGYLYQYGYIRRLDWEIADGHLDFDRDTLTNIYEFTLTTNPVWWDTDQDMLPDHWEQANSLNPKSSTGAHGTHGDLDGDGLSNIEELTHGTKPNNPDTDGDDVNDKVEVDQGSDPNNATDSGQAPDPSRIANVPFTIGDPSGSNSERWKMTIQGNGPDDTRKIELISEDFGEMVTKTFKLHKWNQYTITIHHIATNKEDDEPDYDWEAQIDSKPNDVTHERSEGEEWFNFFTIQNHWVVDNRQALLTKEKHGDETNLVAGKSITLSPPNILADTNRDGAITNDDRSGKDNWTRALGAIYAVNFDRDGNLTHNERPVTDSVMWWEQEGVTEHEDWKINGEQDKNDITPLRIKVPDMPSGTKVYLVAKSEECLRAMHLFSRIKAESQAVWGGFNDEGKPWTDDDEEPLDLDISQWLQPLEGEQGHNANNEKIIAGDYEFGVEGLLFRGMKVPNGIPNDGYGGYLEFTLEIKLPNEDSRKVISSVKMKVAPFLLIHNDRPTDQVFVQAIPFTGLAEPSEDQQNTTPVMPKAARLDTNVVNQWMQDHVEIGYTQRPGGPLTVMTLACPYARGMAEWARDQLLADGKGVFALSKNLGGLTGDFGGNIELTHPQANASLGKIIVGNNASEKLRNFFIAQEEQPLVSVNVSFADAAHVDEIISFGPNQKTYVPDPAAAIKHLRDTFGTTPATLQSRLEAVLFCTDQERAKTTTVFATVQNPQQHYIITSLDYDTHQAAWQPYVDGRLRIVGSNAAGGAQVAYIDSISKATAADHPDANVAGKMKITVADVWNTAQTNPNSRAMQDWNVQNGAPQADWHTAPAQGASIVCVKKSLFWFTGCPSVITVEELLSDADFSNFNETILPPLIQASATSTGALNSIGIPCLFFKQFKSNPNNQNPPPWGAVALTPNAVNLQWVDGVPVLPLPFGPRNQQNVDTIQQLHTNLFPTTPPIFLNDWSTFHRQSGEIHCGSAAKRAPTASWWNQ